MKLSRREFTGSAILSTAALSISASAQEKASSDAPDNVVIRGRVICLTEEYQRQYNVVADCDHRGHVYSLKTSAGRIYPFLPTDSAAAVFLDEKYRERELQVTARLFPQGNFIEVIKLQSWRNGTVYNLGYYCEVCNIWTHKPGPCECCQLPVEFRETLIEPNQ
jgi:hypothetical protein